MHFNDEEDPVSTAPQPSTSKGQRDTRPSHKPQSCDICGKVLRNSTTLKNHYKTHLPPEQRVAKFVCEVCGKGFDIKNQLTFHAYSHRDRKALKCDECGIFVFNLHHHVNLKHKKRYAGTCTICNKNVRNLGNHMKRAHTSPQLDCNVCGKSFGNRTQLNLHMAIHTGVRVKCLFCPHSATNTMNSKAHMKKKHPEEFAVHKREKQSKLYQERRIEGV